VRDHSSYLNSAAGTRSDENITMWQRCVRSNDAVAISATYSALRSLQEWPPGREVLALHD
jgi:hypothetical protein